MKAVIQRVESAKLSVDGTPISNIGAGIVVYFGVDAGDNEEQVAKYAKKIAKMRIFEDENGKMNYSVLDKGYECLAVSQFTLCANCSHGNRPDFTGAEKPERAKLLYEAFGAALSAEGVPVKYGVFGADMRIEQVNAGPVTIVLQI